VWLRDGVDQLFHAVSVWELLVAMFPANVYAALAGLTLGGAPAMALLPRTLLQVVFLAATLTVLAPHLRRWRTTRRRAGALAQS